MSIEAMKQALEALEIPTKYVDGCDLALGNRVKAAAALRTAIAEAEKSNIKQVIHLYDEPPAAQRQPLTDEQIDAVCAPLGFAQLSPREVARAIEAAHGIGGKA
jgi:hypothetical protein